jgi:hypothetical protein
MLRLDFLMPLPLPVLLPQLRSLSRLKLMLSAPMNGDAGSRRRSNRISFRVNTLTCALGSLRMIPFAARGNVSMSEPVHGAAAKCAGKNVANPTAAIHKR